MNDIYLYEKVASLENNFTIKFRLYSAKNALQPHWHEHIELLFFKHGLCDFNCNGKAFSAGEGDLVVVNGQEIHSFNVKRAGEFFSVLLYPSFFADVNINGILLENIIRGDKHIADIMNSIYVEYKKNNIFGLLMMKSYMYNLVAYLIENYTSSRISKKESALQEAKLARLNKVIEHITQNYGEKITTLELAGMCYLSEAHFCRFFKKYIGKSATEYINEYRIEKASILLTSTSESISYISSEVGFDDANYFSRTFKRIKGMSPGEFRRFKNEKNAQKL